MGRVTKGKSFLGFLVFLSVMTFVGVLKVQAANSGDYLQKYAIEVEGNASSSFNPDNSFTADTPSLVSFLDDSGRLHIVYDYLSYESDAPKKIVIKRFDNQMQLEKTVEIKKELPLFGNIIFDGTYYYVVWGQNDSNVEDIIVTRTCKYSMDGALIAYCDLSGYDSNPYANWGQSGESWGTRYPFNAGTCSLAINNGVLACNYARQMYNGHQSNFVFYVDCSTMERVHNSSVVYCSHSFDQRVIVDSNGNYVFINHGDAYYRCFQLDLVTQDRYSSAGLEFFHFREGSRRGYGYNETYAQFGEIIETDKGYFVCASSDRTLSLDYADNRGYYMAHPDARDLFFQVIKKDFYNYYGEQCFAMKGETRSPIDSKPEDAPYPLYLYGDEEDYGVNWLTAYDSNHYVANPHAVKAENGNIILIWDKASYSSYYFDGQMYFTILDSNFKQIIEPVKVPEVHSPGNVNVSYENGKLIWASNDEYGSNINILDIAACIEANNIKEAAISKYQVVFDDKIYLKAYVEASEGILNSDVAFISVTLNGETETYSIDDCMADTGELVIEQGFAGAQLGDVVNIKVINDGQILVDVDYSVYEYLQYIISHQDEDEYRAAAPFVMAMLNYGGYAQKYFKYNTEKLVNQGLYTKENDPVFTTKDFSMYHTNYPFDSFSDDELEYYGCSMVCDDDFGMKFYFDILADDFDKDNYYVNTYSMRGNTGGWNPEIETAVESGKFVIAIKNLPATIWDCDYILYTYDRWAEAYSDMIDFRYSPYLYLEKGIASENMELSNLCKAMYLYSNAAREYFGD